MLKRLAGMALAIAMTVGASNARAEEWTGAYVGGAVGAGAAVHNITVDVAGVEVFDFNGIGGEGVFLSIGGGYDRQFGRFVLGGFVDFDLSFINTRIDVPVIPGVSFDIRHQYSWAVGGRGGLLVNDSTLAYGLIGFTQARFDSSDLGIGSQNYNGILLGAGLETMLTDSLALRAEYRYSHFGEKTRFSFPPIGLAINNTPSMHTARVGVVYKFNNN